MRIYFLAVLSAGVFLRVFGLDIQGLSHDELLSVTISSAGSLNALFDQILSDVHPPLYQLILFFWIKIFGVSEAAIRSLSSMFGILTILLSSHLARKLFDRPVTASFASLISLSGAAIFYAQESRSYGMLLCLSSVSTLLWLILLKRGPRSGRTIFLYTFTGIITSLTHYFGMALIFFQIVYLVIASVLQRRLSLSLMTGSFLILFVSAGWTAFHLKLITHLTGGNFWIGKPDFLFFYFMYCMIFTEHVNAFLLMLVPFSCGAGVFLRNIFTMARNAGLDSPIVALAYLSSVPFLALYALSLHTPVLTARNMIIILPCIYLIIAMLIPMHKHLAGFRGSLYVLFSMSLSLIIFLSFYYQPHKDQYREATGYVLSRVAQGNARALIPSLTTYDYYLIRDVKGRNAHNKIIRYVDAYPDIEASREYLIAALKETGINAGDIYVMKAHCNHRNPDFPEAWSPPNVREAIMKKFDLKSPSWDACLPSGTQEFISGNYTVFEAKDFVNAAVYRLVK